jgi:hypothetical protein
MGDRSKRTKLKLKLLELGVRIDIASKRTKLKLKLLELGVRIDIASKRTKLLESGVRINIGYKLSTHNFYFS